MRHLLKRILCRLTTHPALVREGELWICARCRDPHTYATPKKGTL